MGGAETSRHTARGGGLTTVAAPPRRPHVSACLRSWLAAPAPARTPACATHRDVLAPPSRRRQVFTLYHPPGTDSGEEAGDNLPDYYIGDLLVA